MAILTVKALRFTAVVFCIILTCVNETAGHTGEDLPKLILISMDGFRWDYLDSLNFKFKDDEISHFDKFRKNGAWAKQGMKNTFVTKTMANHVTLATGLYEESHGIMGNAFYDPKFKEGYSGLNNTQNLDPKWYDTGAEPIWVTNQKAGEKHRSGCIMWPGCGAPQKGYVPSRYLLFDETLTFKTRVDILLSWFTLHEPINLGLLYINEPDHTGHFKGTNSSELREMILRLDGVLEYLFEKLEKEDLLEDMNIILTSDHGMISTTDAINLDDYIEPDMYTMYTENPMSMILAKEGKKKEVYKALKKIPKEKLNVYWRKDIPDEYHFKNNDRVTDIVIVAEPPYKILHNNKTDGTVANHGYSNNVKEMHPIFMAYGPSFNNKTVETFSSTDIYIMMCYILDVDSAPNNGSFERVRSLLKPKKPDGGIGVAYFVVIPIVLLVAAVVGVGAFLQRRFRRRKIHVSKGGFEYKHTVLETSLLTDSDRELEEEEVRIQ